jgi:hypothetical protein
MEPDDKISAEQAKKLEAELSALSNEHFKAASTAVYINMSSGEGKAYDQRRTRISRIFSLLERFRQRLQP